LPDLLNRQRNPLGRTVRLLGWMADHDSGDFGVRELAAAVGMAPSTVHRSLGALEEEGLVESSAQSGRYRLSLGFFRLALKGVRRAPLISVALPFLQEAARAGEETAQLAVYGEVELAVMFVAEVAPLRQLQVRARLHEWLPLTSSAAGLAVLSQLDSTSVVTAFAKAAGTHSGSDLAATLDQVRRRGFASATGLPEPGCVELGAAFIGSMGQVQGALGLSLPQLRFNAKLETALGGLLAAQAGKLSAALQTSDA
jgi:DNA-binding IclR family transcriptional regulator